MMDWSKWRGFMGIERSKIEAVHGELRRRIDRCDWDGWADLFAEDATFFNSQLEKPIRGREAIRSFGSAFPSTLVNRIEWVAVDGNRLVFGWNEKQWADGPVYRGFSTFVFGDDGLIASYEGMFDPAEVAAATAP